ncbi:uncharacterized protein G2W53_013817 [Senna tora]|uniref:Uncharacterized protein n=1 Tax=Senna tora TaxID=362788 RepID=A0A834WSU4_9FABA|nr:uncharacterized protein G2W53_013817 [Senna tora]
MSLVEVVMIIDPQARVVDLDYPVRTSGNVEGNVASLSSFDSWGLLQEAGGRGSRAPV